VKIKLAAVAKNEAPYLAQWVFHHSRMGFTDFEIWVNNSSDASLDVMAALEESDLANIHYTDASDFFTTQRDLGNNAQAEAYRRILADSKTDFDYLMFLDLDEFFFTPELGVPVNEFLQNLFLPDAVGIPWRIDTPGEAIETFMLPTDLKTLCNNTHVKTIFRPDSIADVGIHEVFTSSIRYVTPSGNYFQPDSSGTRNFIRLDRIEREASSAFILHTVYKSEPEYIARLGRGRVDPVQGPIKSNRFGYLDRADRSPLDISREVRGQYSADFEAFLLKCGLSDKRSVWLEDVRSQEMATLELLRALGPENYYTQLRGLRSLKDKLGPGKQAFLKHSIDVSELSDEGVLTVSGWAYDWLGQERLEFELTTDRAGKVGLVEQTVTARPDVVAVFPDAPSDCGFILKTRLDHPGWDHSLKLTMKVDDKVIDQLDLTLKSDKWQVVEPSSTMTTWDHSVDPILPSDVLARLRARLKSASVYLEYGSGNSTYMALRDFPKLERVFSVESGREFCVSLAEKISQKESRLSLMWVNVGETKDFGYPADESNKSNYSTYSTAIWDLMASEFKNPDLVLVDGRFRAACFVTTALRALPGTELIFDDYVDRDYYHEVERLIPREGVIGRAAIFTIPAEIDKHLASEMFTRLSLDPR